jgi:hypothetical protein
MLQTIEGDLIIRWGIALWIDWILLRHHGRMV